MVKPSPPQAVGTFRLVLLVLALVVVAATATATAVEGGTTATETEPKTTRTFARYDVLEQSQSYYFKDDGRVGAIINHPQYCHGYLCVDTGFRFNSASSSLPNVMTFYVPKTPINNSSSSSTADLGVGQEIQEQQQLQQQNQEQQQNQDDFIIGTIYENVVPVDVSRFGSSPSMDFYTGLLRDTDDCCCSDPIGRFVIHELVLEDQEDKNNQTIQKLAIDFEQGCQQQQQQQSTTTPTVHVPTMFGYIRINSSIPVEDQDLDGNPDWKQDACTTLGIFSLPPAPELSPTPPPSIAPTTTLTTTETPSMTPSLMEPISSTLIDPILGNTYLQIWDDDKEFFTWKGGDSSPDPNLIVYGNNVGGQLTFRHQSSPIFQISFRPRRDDYLLLEGVYGNFSSDNIPSYDLQESLFDLLDIDIDLVGYRCPCFYERDENNRFRRKVFRVLQAVYEIGTWQIISFAADFEHTCGCPNRDDENNSYRTGRFRYNADPTTKSTTRRDLWENDITKSQTFVHFEAPYHVASSKTSVNVYSDPYQRGGGILVAYYDNFKGSIETMEFHDVQPGPKRLEANKEYHNAYRFNSLGSPGVRISNRGSNCDYTVANFVVHEVTYSEFTGHPTTLAIDFTMTCSHTPFLPYLERGWIRYNSAMPILDQDGDDMPDLIDNCPTVYNPNQVDNDIDLIGDACDDVIGENYLELYRGDEYYEAYYVKLGSAEGVPITCQGNIVGSITCNGLYPNSVELYRFAAAPCIPLTIGHYANAKPWGQAELGEHRFDVDTISADVVGGEFYILEATYDDVTGELRNLAIDFVVEQRVYNIKWKGRIRFNSITQPNSVFQLPTNPTLEPSNAPSLEPSDHPSMTPTAHQPPTGPCKSPGVSCRIHLDCCSKRCVVGICRNTKEQLVVGKSTQKLGFGRGRGGAAGNRIGGRTRSRSLSVRGE